MKAEEFAKQQREISISEFFEKNRHLLGYDNKVKALLMIIKEAVDNSLDAAEEAGLLPDIYIKIKELKPEVYEIVVKYNGPGVVKIQIPRISVYTILYEILVFCSGLFSPGILLLRKKFLPPNLP